MYSQKCSHAAYRSALSGPPSERAVTYTARLSVFAHAKGWGLPEREGELYQHQRKSQREMLSGPHQEPLSAGHGRRLIRSFYAASVLALSQVTFWLWHLTPYYVYPETQATCPH